MQYENNLISIITPVYNAKKYIDKTIASVQQQSYTNWEMILIDDCSTDGSDAIIKELASSDERLRYYRNEANLGAAQSRNKALLLAKGRYVAFLDSDDLWDAKKLSIQIEYMKEHNVPFCFTACRVIDADGQPTGKERHVPSSVDFDTLLKGNVIPCLTVVLDRVAFSKIEMPSIGHEDYALWLSLLKECHHADGIDEVLASYRIAQGSLSGNKLKAATWTFHIYRNYLGLGLCKSMYLMVHYVVRALKKRM